MINTAEQEKRLRDAYYSNRHKKLVLVTLPEDYDPDDYADHNSELVSKYNLDKQVIYQAERTYYRGSYKGDKGRSADSSVSDFDIEGIKRWLENMSSNDRPVRAVAYSALDEATLLGIFWADAPFNNTGGIYGCNANEPESNYEFPKALPPNFSVEREAVKSQFPESVTAAVTNACTVRWTDTIPECRAANTLISLSSKFKLLDMNEILIHI